MATAYFDTPLTADELDKWEAEAHRREYVSGHMVQRLINEVRRMRSPDTPYFFADLPADEQASIEVLRDQRRHPGPLF